MATPFYLTDTASDLAPGAITTNSSAGPLDTTGATYKLLSLTSGASATSIADATVAGMSGNRGWGDTTHQTPLDTVAGSQTFNGTIWISNPLAPATIAATNTITANVRASESSAMANYGCSLEVWSLNSTATSGLNISALCAHGGVTSAPLVDGVELGTAESAHTLASTSTVTSAPIINGGRLVVFGAWVPAGGSTASGFTVSGFYNGPTAAASGDTYVTFSETITESGAPAAADAIYPFQGSGGYYGTFRRFVQGWTKRRGIFSPPEALCPIGG